ncbi:peptidyl-prolyl cis-trans isomerase B (cyclophilin B) [Arachidicoccus rhizosphaerae]|uniref:Peptidyl-prolyl cis-trans isomerase n=1 Tax=Arachidicoccus rhizosphaerae TaxID=551991 RepID=A0A1H3VRT0_9BACT|nr:peptidylprolyl isomerase [Arachidicoccus rhizosphaerae]SDZ77391.1 peptidyl-prolyl cis-trans isomerase B (cyclophilin B) [Arachidicoccus rhizosphaerae]
MIRKILLTSFSLLLILCAVKSQKYRAVMRTDSGKITLELFDGTPKHRDNFIKLARKHFYDGVLFHRVIPGFMIQGGDPDSKNAKPGVMLGDGDVGYTVPAEFRPEYFHRRGALAAAREDNPAKASSGCQFYIVTGKKFSDEQLDKAEKRSGHTIAADHRKIYKSVGGAPHLDQNYTVYGQVLKGMEVADKIVNAKRDKNDRPLKDERIKKIRIRKKILGFWL